MTLTISGYPAFNFQTFHGNEFLSAPNSMKILFTSENTMKDLIGKEASVEINKDHWIHGLIDYHSMKDGGTERQHEIIITAPFYLLRHKKICRSYANQTSLQIITSVFKEHDLPACNTQHITRNYMPREWCVCYHESIFDFVTRLLAEEGIVYYFKHDKNTSTMMLDDRRFSNEHKHQPLLSNKDTLKNPRVVAHSFSHHQQQDSITLRDYNFKNPQYPLASSSSKKMVTYPAKIPSTAAQQLHQQAQLALLQANKNSDTHILKTTYSDLKVNTHITYDHKNFLIVGITYNQHSNEIHCIPSEKKFAPAAQKTPRFTGPVIATVVGSPEKEIEADVYGRIKIKFPWDTEVFTWARLRQPSAGKNHGGLFIPRIGEKVLVDFVDGRPDRPIVIGTLSQKQPFLNRAGIKTKSNTLCFSDAAGTEEILVKTAKNKLLTVNGEYNQKISANHTIQAQKSWAQRSAQFKITAQKSITLQSKNSKIIIQPDQVIMQAEKIHLA